ncbi:MAG: diaminopropionate ammonia-lyase [Spirochaetaceae bacterium]|jgi:diaminopropionate ammonia-lyase|nr:diaminopropionate ammonia-lyase [Spirochaetaceae bacterium]
MKEKITWVKNTLPKTDCAQSMTYLTEDAMLKVQRFHHSFPQYTVTPLVSLKNLARALGVKGIYVKDESFRFGLNSFKVLGGSHAVGRYIAAELGKDLSELDYPTLVSDQTKERLGNITFYATTDGNHGRGVAWAANKLRQKCVIYMPAGTSPSRLNNILREGADASIVDMNYDDAIRYCKTQVEQDRHGVIVQDTDWPGYGDIPAWIMQGYGTVSWEAHNQLRSAGVERPTHVFAQAGVGSFAGSVHGYFANAYPGQQPVMCTVEAAVADCLARSVRAGGTLTAVGGDMPTIMAGLACGEACNLSWGILKNHSDFFISIWDWVTAVGMRMLGAPLPGDTRIISGESGASAAGLVFTALRDAAYAGLRDELGLNGDSEILVISTEGDTDPDRYRRITWDGAYAGD